MAYFVTQYRFDLRAGHAAQQAAAHGHQGRVAARAGGKGIHLGGVVITRTPIMRLAVHFDSAREMSAPPKPQIAANINSPPRPPPVNCTPNTRWMMKITSVSRARTARLVTRNRKMRFMAFTWGKW